MSTVRMAYFSLPAVDTALGPHVRVALGGVHTQDKQMAMRDDATHPALLVSYVYLEPFLKRQASYVYRDWALDSGAFSAHMSGTAISLQSYIDTCKRLREQDPTLAEVFALDVIGDWRASLANTEAMWKAGIEAIPCYHYGEPVDVLKGLAKDYPKIAIGGCARFRADKKRAFASNCFAHVWPCAIHGFGFGAEAHILAFPFHSVDATNWELGPCAFGNWNTYGKMSVRGSTQNLRVEIEYYLDLEQRSRIRWKKQMAELCVGGGHAPTRENGMKVYLSRQGNVRQRGRE